MAFHAPGGCPNSAVFTEMGLMTEANLARVVQGTLGAIRETAAEISHLKGLFALCFVRRVIGCLGILARPFLRSLLFEVLPVERTAND